DTAGTGFALEAVDLGEGPRLFVGGLITTAGGSPAARVAAWNGTSWSPLDSGTNGIIRAFATANWGTGGKPDLFVGGFFTAAFDSLDASLARWACPSAGPNPGFPYCSGDGSA